MRYLGTLASSFSIFVLALPSSAQAVWQVAYPPQAPAGNRDWAAAFDEARGEVVLMFPANNSNQGWRWNGTTWSQIVAPLPPSRSSCYMVYDVARARVVLWSGQATGGGLLNDLWEWDGTAWQQRVVAMPPARYGAAVAYDRARGVTVMFGGYNQSVLLQDTWEWNGVAWSNPTPTVRPSARDVASMAFDPTTGRVLLYGGSGTVDTWSWNGSTWEQHFPTTPPSVRLRQSMVADLMRSRVVLHGGTWYDAQTYEWDGTQWHATMPGTPGALMGAGSVYDTQRQLVLLHGGEAPGIGNLNLTWTYRTTTPATASTFGTGCAGSVGVPQLANAPYSLPWIGDTVRTVVSQLAPITPGALFVTSFVSSFLPMSLAPLGAPGCDLLLPPDFLSLALANGSSASLSLAIPANTSLLGVSVYQQAFPFEPEVNPLGVTASNGLRLVLGLR